MRKNFPNWSDFSEKLFSLFIRALHLFGHLFSLCCEDKWLFCSFSCPNHHFFAEQNCHLLPSWKGACLFHGFTTILRGRIFQFLLSQTWWTLLAQCFHYCKGSRSRLRFKSFPRIRNCGSTDSPETIIIFIYTIRTRLPLLCRFRWHTFICLLLSWRVVHSVLNLR